MDEPDLVEEVARGAAIEPEKAKEVLELAEEARAKQALRRAKEALAPPPDAGRTGFFPSFRRQRA